MNDFEFRSRITISVRFLCQFEGRNETIILLQFLEYCVNESILLLMFS